MSQGSVASTRHSRLPWMLLALVVGLIAGVTLYQHFRSADGQGKSTSATSDPDTDRIVARDLSPDEMRALAARSSRQAGSATVQDMAGMMEKRERMAEATQSRNRDRSAAMAARFDGEKADPAWSATHEKDLASLQDSGPMLDAGVKARDFQAECRSSMCRIQADFPTRSMANDWLQLFMSSAGDRLPVATAHQVTNPDGSVRVEIHGVGRKQ